MVQSLDLFKSVAKPASVQQTELLTHIASVFYSDDTLPLMRSSQNYAQHLQFIRYCLAIPADGAGFYISREAGYATLTSYIQAAILNGWLDESFNPDNGKRMVRRSQKLNDLVVTVSEVV